MARGFVRGHGQCGFSALALCGCCCLDSSPAALLDPAGACTGARGPHLAPVSDRPAEQPPSVHPPTHPSIHLLLSFRWGLCPQPSAIAAAPRTHPATPCTAAAGGCGAAGTRPLCPRERLPCTAGVQPATRPGLGSPGCRAAGSSLPPASSGILLPTANPLPPSLAAESLHPSGWNLPQPWANWHVLILVQVLLGWHRPQRHCPPAWLLPAEGCPGHGVQAPPGCGGALGVPLGSQVPQPFLQAAAVPTGTVPTGSAHPTVCIRLAHWQSGSGCCGCGCGVALLVLEDTGGARAGSLAARGTMEEPRRRSWIRGAGPTPPPFRSLLLRAASVLLSRQGGGQWVVGWQVPSSSGICTRGPGSRVAEPAGRFSAALAPGLVWSLLSLQHPIPALPRTAPSSATLSEVRAAAGRCQGSPRGQSPGLASGSVPGVNWVQCLTSRQGAGTAALRAGHLCCLECPVLSPRSRDLWGCRPARARCAPQKGRVVLGGESPRSGTWGGWGAAGAGAAFSPYRRGLHPAPGRTALLLLNSLGPGWEGGRSPESRLLSIPCGLCQNQRQPNPLRCLEGQG